jgi:hypothetical protein
MFTFQERDFDKHVAYCRDEPVAQEFLQENESVRDYFEVSRWFQILKLVVRVYNVLLDSKFNNTHGKIMCKGNYYVVVKRLHSKFCVLFL